LDQIRRRDARLAQRIGAAIVQSADHDAGDVRKLAGCDDVYRLRIGDWRVVFSLEDGGRAMLVLRVLNRRDAYR